MHLPSPIPRAKALSEFEQPAIDGYHLCLHLASDDPEVLSACGRALQYALAPALRLRQTRTGFAGAGLPAAHQRVGGHPVQGIPPGNHVPPSAPLFMGFKSALKKNQATEDAVTIASGEFAQGTTMAVSHMTLQPRQLVSESDVCRARGAHVLAADDRPGRWRASRPTPSPTRVC